MKLFGRCIVSQSEGIYFDVEKMVVGEDEDLVVAKVNALFRKIIDEKEAEKDDPMTNEEIEDAMMEGSYFDDMNWTLFEVHIFAPGELVVVPSQKEFEQTD